MSESEPEPRDLGLMPHFKDFIAHRRSLLVITSQGLELEAIPEAVETERNRLLLFIATLPPYSLTGPERITLALAIQGNRWEGPSRVHFKVDRLRVAVELPLHLVRKNRRYAERVVPEAESLHATLKLGREGPMITGILVDLSAGGFCLRIERVYDLATQRRLEPGKLGLTPDQGLDSVEISGFGQDSLEASGVVRELEHCPEGYYLLRVQFRALLRGDRAFLAEWVQRRTEQPPEHLPPLEAE